MSKKTKTNSYKQTRMTDIVRFIYVCLIFTVYLLFMHDKYFDITKTRYTVFINTSLFFILFFIAAAGIDSVLESDNINLQKLSFKNINYKSPVTWMGAFLICNGISFIFAVEKKNALYGSEGRYMGYIMYFVLSVVFILIAIRMKTSLWLYMLLLVTTLWAYYVAINQHMGNDFMHLRDKIARKQFYKYVSVFGNINVFACFIVMALAVSICVCIYCDSKVYRIFGGVVTFFGGMSIMIANSDSAYLGLCVEIVLLLFMAIREGYVVKLFVCLSLLAAGNLCQTILNKYVVKKYDKQGGIGKEGGIAQLLDNIGLAVLMLAFVVIVTLIAYALKNKTESINKNKASYIFLITVGVLFVLFIIVGRALNLSLLDFNYRWGTYRGYIWTKCMQIFDESPLIHKLFGYGQESVRMLTVSGFNDEMIEITGKVYDNAHNELLQYLLTIGLFGVISYVGTVAASFVYIIKSKNKNVITYISATVIIGYFAQSLVNLNQPITTPLFFVLMAMGVGNATYVKAVSDEGKGEGK